jgi:RND family efflux transporter MFP subunit
MVKKNLLGIVVVVLIAAAFAGGYVIGRGAAPQMNPAQHMEMAGSRQPPGLGGPPADNASQSEDADAQASESVTPAPAEKPANALEFYGTTAPSAEVNVQSQQGGTLIVLNGEEGDFVQKGALLAQFDDSEQQLNLDNARSSRNTALQQVQQAESNLKSTQTNLKRNRQLFKDGLISQQQIDDLENTVESARTSLNNAQESVRQANTQISLLENELKNFSVHAPISGIIDQKNYNLQEIYGGNGVLYHIVNIDEVYVNVDVPETYIKRICEGMEVSVTFNALGDQIFPGILETVLPSGSTTNRTFTAKVRVKSPDQAIKPGMFAAVEMVLLRA